MTCLCSVGLLIRRSGDHAGCITSCLLITCRLEDLYVIDMKFLHGHTMPTVAYLTEVMIHVHVHIYIYMDRHACSAV